mgnify:CR=1 FL=1
MPRALGRGCLGCGVFVHRDCPCRCDIEEPPESDGGCELRGALEQLQREVLAGRQRLEEALECPVCFEVTTTAPIYKCEDDHLICRFLAPLAVLLE